MRKLMVLSLLAVLFSCENNDKKTEASETKADSVSVRVEDSPKMVFQEISFDFGKVRPGEIVRHSFEFTNQGTKPLIVSNAYASCGCTVPKWTKEPVPPGGKGVIDVEFNTAGKKGVQSKKVNIKANTVPEDNFVELNGVVEE